MSTDGHVHLCQPCVVLDDAWRSLYTSAFPESEREPEEKLQQLIDEGRLLLHKTTGKKGELLCFSMVSLASNFAFLAYIATDPNQRSGGYGSKHMKALIERLKNEYPDHLGMVLEIESTHPRFSQLSADEASIRSRRFGFYKRLGFKRMCRSMEYVVPNRTGEGVQELDVLFLAYQDSEIVHATKNMVVEEILQRFYLLEAHDSQLSKVLNSICSCSHPKCEEEQTPAA